MLATLPEKASPTPLLANDPRKSADDIVLRRWNTSAKSRCDAAGVGNPYKRYPERETYEAYAEIQRPDGTRYTRIAVVSRWGTERSMDKWQDEAAWIRANAMAEQAQVTTHYRNATFNALRTLLWAADVDQEADSTLRGLWQALAAVPAGFHDPEAKRLLTMVKEQTGKQIVGYFVRSYAEGK